MSDGSEKDPQTKLFWSVSSKNEGNNLIHIKGLLKLVKVPVPISYDYKTKFRCAYYYFWWQYY